MKHARAAIRDLETAHADGRAATRSGLRFRLQGAYSPPSFLCPANGIFLPLTRAIEINITYGAHYVQELCETWMTARIHSLWLMASLSDEAMLTGLVGELAGRFGTPLFTPHLTLQGDTTMPPDVLERAAAAVAETVPAFSEAVALVEGSEAFFRSFYARFAVSQPLAALKRALDPEGYDSFMPHVSLLYGPVETAAKAAAIAEVNARLAGRMIRFDRIGIVTSGQDIPIPEWRVVASARLRAA